MPQNTPKVSIIIVNFNGKKFLQSCIDSILNQTYPQEKIEIIIVDNSSSDGSVFFLRKNYPSLKIIELSSNLGFTGGNNVGIDHATGDYLIFLNNDTAVDSHWVEELIDASKSIKTGIVSSKLLLAVPYLRLKIESTVIQQSDIDASADFSPRGVLMQNIVSHESSNQLIWYESGFEEAGTNNGLNLRWMNGSGQILLPMSERINTFTFTFHGYPSSNPLNSHITLRIANKVLFDGSIQNLDAKKITLKIDKNEFERSLVSLVQNAGNILLRNGYSKDRGSILRIANKNYQEFYESNIPFFNREKKLLSACGAAMLVKRSLIDQIGKFDGHFFMYYEDVDYCLRAWQMGWDILYAPKAIVYHYHRGSTGKNESSFFLNLTERNHLFLLIKHFPISTCINQYLHFLLRTIHALLMRSVCRFTNWSKRDLYNLRAKGRLDACVTFHHLLSRMILNRLSLRRNRKRGYDEFQRFLY